MDVDHAADRPGFSAGLFLVLESDNMVPACACSWLARQCCVAHLAACANSAA